MVHWSEERWLEKAGDAGLSAPDVRECVKVAIEGSWAGLDGTLLGGEAEDSFSQMRVEF